MAAKSEPRATLREVAADGIESARVGREVTMLEVAQRQVSDHVSANVRIEQGGALVGEVDQETATISISGAIPAHRAQGTAASLTFTHDAWDEINDAQSERFPGLHIVGWYHSHPDFGIFLSEYDKFIQQNFFSAPWQVAYVIDPIRNQTGLFGWENGAIVSIPKWREVASSGRSTVRTNGHGVARDRAPGIRAARSGRGDLIRMGFVALLVGLVGGYFIRAAGESTVSLTSGSLPAVSLDHGLTVARSWVRTTDKVAMVVTVDNQTKDTVTGSIANCAPSEGTTGSEASQSCQFVNNPLASHSQRTYLFTETVHGGGGDPWSGLPLPTYISQGP